MSTLRLAGPVLGLLLLAALSALASPSENVLDGADSQELLIVQAPAATMPELTLASRFQGGQLAYAGHPAAAARPGIIPFAGENIPEGGQ